MRRDVVGVVCEHGEVGAVDERVREREWEGGGGGAGGAGNARVEARW